MTIPQGITIIGAGKVGTSLHKALKQRGQNTALVGKDKDQQLKSASQASVVLITVQDRHIGSVCELISSTIKPKTVVAHCSGAMSCDVLYPVKNIGALVGTAHPLNTFPTEAAAIEVLAKQNHNTHCFISGMPEASNILENMFNKLDFNTVRLNDEAKIAYHAACVFACNYLTSLAEFSLQTAELAGLDRAQFWQAIQPLMLSTLNNISDSGTASALSGPIARDDTHTVQKHLSQIKHGPELLQQAYQVLGQQAWELANSRQELDQETLSQLKDALS